MLLIVLSELNFEFVWMVLIMILIVPNFIFFLANKEFITAKPNISKNMRPKGHQKNIGKRASARNKTT